MYLGIAERPRFGIRAAELEMIPKTGFVHFRMGDGIQTEPKVAGTKLGIGVTAIEDAGSIGHAEGFLLAA